MTKKTKKIQTLPALTLAIMASNSHCQAQDRVTEPTKQSFNEVTDDAKEGDNSLFVADYGYTSNVRSGMESQASPNKIEKGSV